MFKDQAPAIRALVLADDAFVRVLSLRHADGEQLRSSFALARDRLIARLHRDGEGDDLIGQVRRRCDGLARSIPMRHKGVG